MDFTARVAEYTENSEIENHFTQRELRQLVSILDLTTLNPGDTDENIKQLCQKANSPLGPVACVCVYPKFVPIVAKELNSKQIKIASVANFPTGNEDLKKALADIQSAKAAGANEMDIVLPYTLYKQGKEQEAFNYIKECKALCDKMLLKIILETSEFDNLEEIYTLSMKVIENGADFIKTSTGKSKQGATLEASSVMLLAIKSSKDKKVGFKASGGIREIKQALSYISLGKKIMGEDWIKAENMRIGASVLLDRIVNSEIKD